jgi:hypothetical protein
MLFVFIFSGRLDNTARPTEQARFAAAFERRQHINDLNPCLEDLGSG